MKPYFTVTIKTILIVATLLQVVLSAVAISASQSKDEIADATVGIDLNKSAGGRQLNEILKTLSTDPSVAWADETRQKLKASLVRYKDQQEGVLKEIERLRIVLDGLGEKNGDGSPVIHGALSSLVELKQQKEFELAETRLLILSAQEILKKLDNYIYIRQARSLFFKDEPLWRIVTSESYQFSLPKPPLNLVLEQDGRQLLVALVAALLWFANFSARIRNFITDNCPANNTVRNLILTVFRQSLAKRFFLGTICILTVLINLLPPVFSDYPYLAEPVLLLFNYVVILFFIRITTIRFHRVEQNDSGCPEMKIDCIGFYLFSFFTVMVITTARQYGYFHLVFGRDPLLGSGLLLLWFGALYLAVRHVTRAATMRGWQMMRLPLLIILIILSCLKLAGYANLVGHIAGAFGCSCFLAMVGLICYDSVDPVVAFLRKYMEKLASGIGVTRIAKSTRMRTHKILSFGLKAYAVTASTVLILHQWGITNVDNEQLIDFFLHGSELNGFPISPARVTLALLVFIICWPSIAYIKQILDTRWLTKEGFSSSSRDTILTVFGYIGYAAILLIMLGVGGVKLTGLTVIIGALSVGIGFGLQNIVNNFISGLILMFERPIKKGDWIVVGSTEGYVKKISIRSTIVQTFDRSDVIVPNSELIANQVTNMMFEDQRGRLRISVGVAYGSDTELVQKLLLEAGDNHPQVITDGSTPVPRAWFQGFGDSSLNFDLLCHLKDIDQKLKVRSELNMAIDKAFRHHGIEIPFPQMDVHLK